MRKIILRRFLGLIPLFIGITFISFLVIHLAPGDAVDAQTQMQFKMTAQAKARLTQMYGLDKPLLTQYTDWMGRLLHLDFGRSFGDGRGVWEKITGALPITILVNAVVLLISVIMGVLLGLWTAYYRGRWFEKAISLTLIALISAPIFWLSLGVMSLLGVDWGWLPVSGIHSLFYEDMSFAQRYWDLFKHLAMPVFVSSLAGVAAIARFTQNSFSKALQEDYIRTARAKGLSETQVLFRHTLPNALLPLVTILGLSIPAILGGSVILETIFSLPGMGRLFFQSVFSRDYPVIMGILVIGAVATLLGNFIADISYTLADPRIRRGGHE